MESTQPKSILKKAPTAGPAPKGSFTLKAKGKGKKPEPEQLPEPESETDESDDGSDSLQQSDSDEEDDDEEDADAEDDEDQIRAMGEDKPKAPKKVKNTTLKPTAAPSFSLALTHLLSLPPSTSSLQPKHKPPSAHTARLERRAKNLIRETKAAHFERGHVKDIIAGWGPRPNIPFALWESKDARKWERAQRGNGESHDDEDDIEETGAEREKRLRRLAQRGVVRLFNAIAAAQGVPEKVKKEEKKKRKREDAGSEAGGSEFTGVGGEDGAPPNKVLRRPNVLGGRGKGEALTNLSKASFLDLIRQGTTPAVITTR